MEAQNNNSWLVAQWNNWVIFCQEHLALRVKIGKISVPNIEHKELYLMTLQEINDELTERQLDTEEYILDDQTMKWM